MGKTLPIFKSHRHSKVINKPVALSSLTFDDLFDEFSDNWEGKAKKLQVRRWRQLKHQLDV